MEWDTGSNVYIRPNNLWKAGDKTVGHTHTFDHTTIVLKGSVHVVATLPEGLVIERDFGVDLPNGNHFLVLANVEHEITALVDGTLYWCVYAHRTPQGEVVQKNTGWPEAYR